jgi:energy-coupling factor transporter ATP-binding protein EcfA2
VVNQTAGPDAILEVDAVTVRRPHRSQPVLEDVSFGLWPGERVVLLGGNGSGKTTLVRLLNGTLLPDAGQVRVQGKATTDPGALHEVRRCVGMLFQDPDNQFVTTTAEREIAFGLENLQQTASSMRTQVDAALDDFDLARYRHTPPHEMSGGEKARLALASVWVMGARVLVLDETESLLDRRASERLHERMQTLPAATIVLQVTTDVDLAADADRVLVLHDGRLIADGPPDSVWSQLPEPVVERVGLPLVWRLSQQVQPAGSAPTGSWSTLMHRLHLSTNPTTNPITSPTTGPTTSQDVERR